MREPQQSDPMNRHCFLKSLGLKGAALASIYFTAMGHQSCNKAETVAPPSGFTIDLDDPAYAALKNNGGHIVKNSVVVARTNTGDFVAVTLICSHADLPQVVYQTDRFYCPAHGAEFDNAGKGLNKKGQDGLTVFKTTVSGRMLTVTV